MRQWSTFPLTPDLEQKFLSTRWIMKDPQRGGGGREPGLLTGPAPSTADGTLN